MGSVSQRIRYYRNKRGLTQTEVATALGIRTDNYSKYESGARVPRDDRLVRLAKILGVSFDALNEGVERGFADLLHSHAVGVIVGDSGSFSAFALDMEQSVEAYSVISHFFNKGEHKFAAENAQFYQKYMAQPGVVGLIALYDLYKEECDVGTAEQTADSPCRVHYQLDYHLDAATSLKWAFCVAVNKYMDRNSLVTIMDETEELMGDLVDQIGVLQFFAVKVFVPYLSMIIDAVELCMNTKMDDFEKAFLFYALTPPDEWDDTEDDEDE
jgi:transcriptional regulator with XRE-family HTH domain